MKKALVVLSGGQDSTTCLFWALREFGEVHAVSFDYQQRHGLELELARDTCEELGVEHQVLDLSLLNQLTSNALTRTTIDVAEGKEGSLPSTFVDGRNMLFLTFTAVLAKQLGIRNIVTGVCQTDFSGYPDCRNNFILSLNTTLNLAMDYDFAIHTPLMWLDKAQTWNLAKKLHCLEHIKEKTLTCYNGVVGKGCGTCPACLLRNKGYEDFLERFGE